MSEGGCKQQEGPDEKEHQSTSFGHRVRRLRVAVESDWVVPGEVNDYSHKRVPGKFDDNVRQNEDLPRVSLGRSLSHLVKCSLGDEVWHDLLNQVAEDCEKHENGEKLVLHSLEGCWGMPEGETDKEALIKLGTTHQRIWQYNLQ